MIAIAREQKGRLPLATMARALGFSRAEFYRSGRMDRDVELRDAVHAIALDWPGMVGWQRAAIGLLWLRSVWRFYSRVGRAHFPAGDTILSILGVPMFIYLLLRSRFSRRVTWKGRTYAKRA